MIFFSNIIEKDMQSIYSTKLDWNKLRGKTLMITGANGMLASYFVLYLIYLNSMELFNIHIIVVVRNKDKFVCKIKKYVNCDVENIEIIESDLTSEINYGNNIDYIIHAASLASPNFYDVCPVDVFMPNVIGTNNLFKLATRVLNKNGSFLYFSSGDVYGKVVSDNDVKYIHENEYGTMDPLEIHSCYSEAKRMGETICMSYSKQYNIKVLLARIAHTYSPSMDINNDPRVFASFVKNIVNKEDIVMHSDGMAKRCFMYITDAIIAFFTILFYGKSGEAYNVCNQTTYTTILDFANALASIVENEYQVKVVRKERSAKEHYVENNSQKKCNSIMTNDKLSCLGFKCKIGIKEGFKKVIDYKRKELQI